VSNSKHTEFFVNKLNIPEQDLGSPLAFSLKPEQNTTVEVQHTFAEEIAAALASHSFD
jgi:hypothetical protein